MVPLLFGTACLSLFSLAHFSQATNTTPNRFLITSPKACFENVDCDATTSYCNDSCHCALRLGVNETCTSHDGECRDGLQCWTNQRSYESVCRRARPIGASCAHVQMSPCVDGAFCSKRTRTCRKLGGKKVGAYCNWRIGCRNDLGLYCNDDKNRCETLRKTGAKCELYDNTLCKGFCTDSLATSQYYMCFPAVGEGKRCLQDDQCHGNPLDKADISNSLVCNQNSNRAQFSGICIRHSRLLPHLGIACNPQRDACDSRKGLRCLWAKSRKAFVCQQRDDAANTAEKFCTPGSALSTCEDRMKPRECRRPGDLGEAPYGFFSCEDRLDRTPVKKGRLCYGVCEAGTSCLLIDSVLGWAYKGPPQPVRYCVRVARKGQACGNKFRSQCAVGLKCGPKKKCVKGVRNTPSAVTHVGLAVSCDKLPCSPGLVCERDQVPSHQSGRGSSWRDVRCKKPKKMVKAGQACYETRGFRPTCEDGLACSLNAISNDVWRCRNGLQVGDDCTSDDVCRGKLKCASTLEGMTRKCYNETLSLPLGAACNVSVSATQKRCTVASFQGYDRSTSCLPNGGKFVCQFGAPAYYRCSEKMNIGCLDSGAVCVKLGVCVPSD